MKNTLNIEDIPVSYRDIAMAIGVDGFIKLCKILGGTSIYLPKCKSILKPIRDENIKKEFNGSNYKELSLKYDICETQIRKILSK